jgi:hypothetical protein
MTILLRLAALLLAAALLAATATPGLASHTYTVQPGDILSAIAERFGTTIEALARANDIADPDRIYPGQVLIIPHDAGAAPPPPAPSLPAGPRGGATGPDSLLARSRVLTYYGNPLSAQMGILGELSKAELVARLRRLAGEYERAGGRPVKPALHVVATVAQDSPGPDGLWRARMPAGLLQEYADLAAANDMLFIIDLQIGHSDWPTEIEAMRALLSQPHVHLAMDPEFDMEPGQAPGDYLGNTKAADINHAIRYLAGLSGELNLPPKLLIIHQFRASMLPDKAAIVDDPRVDVVIDMDGFGAQADKLDVYQAVVRDQPVEFAGIKLFYRQDIDLLTPAQVVALTPSPDVIIYQ